MSATSRKKRVAGRRVRRHRSGRPLSSTRFLPGESAQSPDNNLPAQTTSFIGREREIRELKDLLWTSRLVTLSGAGGVGKTRLALELAAEVSGRFPDGVWFSELAALSEPDLVPKTVASALGIPEQSGRESPETLKAYLGSRTLLLLLDNCEHVLAACAELVTALLEACPSLRVLATSREELGIAGELTYRVPSLSSPDPHTAPKITDLTQYEATRLFVERARFRDPRFKVTESNAAAIVQLCNRLDGIPLAIELAAARVKSLAVEQIASRLVTRFSLLTGGSRTALPRQRTLEATMDWSYGLLTDKERLILHRLSVFAGGWTLASAEAICTGGAVTSAEILDLLTSLVQKSLVIMEAWRGEARYRFLETVRQYGSDRLQEAAELTDLRRRHFDWYLILAERAEPELSGPHEDVWGERLEEEHANLRLALEWGITQEMNGEPVLRLAGALGYFWNRRAHAKEGRAWLERALLRGGGAAAGVRAKALGHAGMLARVQGDYARAAALGRESLDLFLKLEDKRGIAYALYQLGSTADYRGDAAEAKRFYAESLAHFQEVGDKRGISRVLNNLGEVARAAGDYGAARAFYEESLAISREVGSPSGIANALANLGAVSLYRGNHTEAAMLTREALVQMRKLEDKRNIIAVLTVLAGVAMAEGKPERAARLLGAAEALQNTAGVLVGSADRAEKERQVASVRDALDKDTFESAWAEGRAMTLEQAIEYALAAESN
jgi:predicted ATPase